MILVLVSYHCKEGKRETFLESIKSEGIHAFVLAEAGNICYDYFYSDKEKDTLLLVEKWTDKESVDAHSSTEKFARLQELKALYVDNTQIERFEV